MPVLTNAEKAGYDSHVIDDTIHVTELEKDSWDNKLESIVGSSNISIDNSDPLNPIISAPSSTTAGILTRIYATGNTTTLSSGTYYRALQDDEGTVSTATQTVVVPDNTKDYYAQDFITDATPEELIYYAGTYSGYITVSSDTTIEQAKFTVEVYYADANGNVVDSGILTEPVGDLGVRPIAILETGIEGLRSNNTTSLPLSVPLAENFMLSTGYRIRFHVSGEKIGTDGSTATLTLYFGSSYNTFVDTPVAVTTDTVLNKSGIPEITTSAALDWLNTNKTAYSPTAVLSNALAPSAWVVSYSGSSNIDHIWHDEGTNAWHFCSDTTFKASGNSAIYAGKAYLTGLSFNSGTIDNQAVRQISDASLSSGTHTFNYSNGDMQQLTATGNITIAFSNMPSSAVSGFIIDAVNWGAHTITHPASMLFAGGVAPSYTVSGTDRLLVTKDKDGIYTLTIIAQDLKVVT